MRNRIIFCLATFFLALNSFAQVPTRGPRLPGLANDQATFNDLFTSGCLYFSDGNGNGNVATNCSLLQLSGGFFLIGGGSASFNLNSGKPQFPDAAMSGVFTSYDNLTTAGLGLPVQRAVVRLVSQVSAIGFTTAFTVGASNAEFKAEFAINCDTTSAAAAATVSIRWTDPSSTVQTFNPTGIACTTLGSSSYASVPLTFNAKAATAIQYSTAIVNTPTYDLRGGIYQLTTN